MKMNNQVIVGTLKTGKTGYWFECADESAGADANIFDSAESAEAAIKDLGWDAEIHNLEEIKSKCDNV